MKKLLTLVTVTACLVLAGCSPLEQQARNTGAALNGMIVAAQAKYQTSCAGNPNQSVCQKINNAVSAQNALVTSVELYCGWSTLAPPTDPNAVCTPVKSAQAALTAAIANTATLTVELKGAL